MAPLQPEPHTPETAAAWQGRTARSTEIFGLAQLVFALPYGVLLIWFHWVDVYHKHFAEPGIVVIAYNGFRVLAIFYLFWIVAAAGLLLLRITVRQELDQLDVFERLALGFFSGTGIWHVVMLVLGYLDLYTMPAAIVLTLPLVVYSYIPARTAACDIYRAFAKHGSLDKLDWMLLALAATRYSPFRSS